MSEQNKATARRLYEEIITGGNLDAIEDVFATEYQDHDPANRQDVHGLDEVRREIEMYRNAFDLQMTVEDQLAEGNEVTTRWRMRGTHKGELMGVAPTGNKVEVTGTTIHRFAEGKIREGWWEWDTLGLLRQIGAAPAMA